MFKKFSYVNNYNIKYEKSDIMMKKELGIEMAECFAEEEIQKSNINSDSKIKDFEEALYKINDMLKDENFLKKLEGNLKISNELKEIIIKYLTYVA